MMNMCVFPFVLWTVAHIVIIKSKLKHALEIMQVKISLQRNI